MSDKKRIMKIILGFFLALFLNIVLVPTLMKFSSRLRLNDVPDFRKTHSGAVPRVGGLGIAFSSIIPCLILLRPHDGTMAGFLLGASIIVVFGVLDDRFNLDYRLKFLGQVIAAIIVISFGVNLQHLPLFGLDAVPGLLAYPMTLIFLIGITNAFNLLDGLDGLAAGSAMLSLAAISFLASLTGNGYQIILISTVAIGGILGFLRYNTHPAVVFMGDAGSQLIGFSVAVLAILLIEKTENAMSPAIIFLLLGHPILDTTLVMSIRLSEGRSPFSPDRNHIHHKLLGLGLKHHQAVATIYGLQSLMILFAYLLRFEADLTIIFVYLAICFSCIIVYLLLRNFTSRPALSERRELALRLLSARELRRWIAIVRPFLVRYIELSLAAYLMIGALMAVSIPAGISALAPTLSCLTIVIAVFLKQWSPLAIRLSSYLATLYISYLSVTAAGFEWANSLWFNIWLGTVGVSVGFLIAFIPRDKFELSTMDLLIVLIVAGVLAVKMPGFDQTAVTRVVVRSLIMMYVCDTLISIRTSLFGAVGLSSTLSLLATGAHLFH